MHVYALIPLLALCSGSALAAAIVARAPRVRANWVVAAMLACCGGWAGVDFVAGTARSAAEATLWFRLIGPFALLLGPLCLLAAAGLRADVAQRARREAALACVLTGVVSLAALLTPWFVPDSVPTPWGGWQYHLGPLAALVVAQGAWFPVRALVLLRGPALARPAGPERAAPGDAVVFDPAVMLGIAIPLAVVLITDVSLPALGVAFPRLGTLTMACFGGSFWFRSVRTAEGALSDSGFARAIFDELPDGVALIERDGRIRSVNVRFSRLCGRDSGELAGRAIRELVSLDEAELRGEISDRDGLLRRAGAGPIPVAASTSSIRDRQGSVIGWVLVVRDLRGVLGLRSQLVTAGRLAAMGELAAGIAHEVNNPIAFIQANLNQLAHHHEAVAKALDGAHPSPLTLARSRRIAQALESVAQVESVVRDVRSFAHVGLEERRLYDVNELVASAYRLATLELGAGARIAIHYGEIPLLRGSGQELKQAFLGLIRRAATATARRGRVVVRTEADEDSLAVVIEDDGEPLPPGELDLLPPDELASMADAPTVLELGIARRVVQRHHGTLAVESRSGGGTRVRVAFPLRPESDADLPLGPGPC